MKNKKIVIVGGIIIVILLLVIGYWLIGRKNSQPIKTTTEPTEVVIPTIDSSVKVNLSTTIAGKEVVLSIKDIPKNTEIIDYELSYQTQQQGLQGVIGTITVSKENQYEKKLTLGTCSSGTCVYHQVVGKIKLTLKFTGGYGEKLFEKEYGI
jgi:hypothetical protein